MAGTDDLTKFMQLMQTNMEKISIDIKASKDDLKKDFNDGRKEMREELKIMNSKIDEVRNTVEKEKVENQTRFE